MKEVSIYDLVSAAIIAGDNDALSQYKNICGLFIDGLFEEVRIFEQDGGYLIQFEGYTGTGRTPALALKELLQSVVNALYFAENGRP